MKVPGQIVSLESLSHDSYYLYRKFEQYSPLMICPCKLRSTTLCEVIDQVENMVILKVIDRDALTVVYEKDLINVYEPNSETST